MKQLLDAQDGLLIEELLVTGRTFERSFENLMVLESRQQATLLALDQSKQNIKAVKNAIGAKPGETNEQISRVLHSLNLFALLMAISTAARIVVNGSRIVREIKKTVAETRKIRQDLSYQIGIDGNNFAEFRIVFQALNSMAFKINDHMQMLQKARDELEVRVNERTRDLSKMEAGRLERIFNPIEQAESSASRTYQGTGLGLSLTKNLVKLHGGRIWAASEGEGQGSMFSFILPI